MSKIDEIMERLEYGICKGIDQDTVCGDRIYPYLEALKKELAKQSEADKMLDWIDKRKYGTHIEITASGKYIVCFCYDNHRQILADNIRNLINKAMTEKP